MSEAIGRILVAVGAVLALLGGLVLLLSRFVRLGHLPLDIRIERGRSAIYLPLGSAILISLLATLLLNLLLRLRR